MGETRQSLFKRSPSFPSRLSVRKALKPQNRRIAGDIEAAKRKGGPGKSHVPTVQQGLSPLERSVGTV